ncbi:MAG: hypothetical protein WA960_17020 [Tunicatimonas sp.]
MTREVLTNKMMLLLPQLKSSGKSIEKITQIERKTDNYRWADHALKDKGAEALKGKLC